MSRRQRSGLSHLGFEEEHPRTANLVVIFVASAEHLVSLESPATNLVDTVSAQASLRNGCQLS